MCNFENGLAVGSDVVVGMTPYGNVQEEIPDNCPPPLGNQVITTTFIDANLYHDFLTGRSVTGVVRHLLVNQTVIDFYSKKQNTVERWTYGSEFVAARRPSTIL